MIHVADHHLGRAPRRAARLDRTRGTVTDLEEAHQPRGLAAARQLLAFAAQAGEVGTGARSVFEETRLTHPQVHDAAFVHQIVLDRLDEAGMRLRVFIGAVRLGQLSSAVIDVEVALPRTVDAIGPVQTGVEPLRAVRRSHLAGQHIAHLVVIGARIGLGGEVATLPAPIGPGTSQTVEHLLGRGFAHDPLILRQRGQRLVIRDRAPQEFGNALLAHALQCGGDASLAEVFLRQHVRGHLAPAFGHLDGVVAEHDLAIRIANFGSGGCKSHRAIGAGRFRRELALDLHLPRRPAVTAHSRRCCFNRLMPDRHAPIPTERPSGCPGQSERVGLPPVPATKSGGSRHRDDKVSEILARINQKICRATIYCVLTVKRDTTHGVCARFSPPVATPVDDRWKTRNRVRSAISPTLFFRKLSAHPGQNQTHLQGCG